MGYVNIRGRVIKVSTSYIVEVSEDVFEKLSKLGNQFKAIVTDGVNKIELCLEVRKWSDGTCFLKPCTKRETMILHQLFHGKLVNVEVVEPVSKIKLVNLLREFIEDYMFVTKTNKLHIYCTEYENNFIIHARKTKLPNQITHHNDIKRIYFDEGFEIRINKNRVIEKTCNEIMNELQVEG